MRILARSKPDQNDAALDPWTLVHFATGLAAGLMNVPFRWAITASVAYEVAEQFGERREWVQEIFEAAGPESLPNAVGDTVFFALGHRLGAAWNGTGRAESGTSAE